MKELRFEMTINGDLGRALHDDIRLPFMPYVGMQLYFSNPDADIVGAFVRLDEVGWNVIEGNGWIWASFAIEIDTDLDAMASLGWRIVRTPENVP